MSVFNFSQRYKAWNCRAIPIFKDFAFPKNMREQAVSVCPKHKLAPHQNFSLMGWLLCFFKSILFHTHTIKSYFILHQALRFISRLIWTWRTPQATTPMPNAATIVPTYCLMHDTHLFCVQNRVSTLKTVLIFQKEAFEEMAAKFSRFSDRVNELLAKQGSKSLNRWIDNQEVCQQLNISPRTLQTLRDNGTLAYSQINRKVFYRPEDVLRIVKPVEGKLADKAVWLLCRFSFRHMPSEACKAYKKWH